MSAPPLSKDNRDLLEWKLGRAMTPGLKVTLTVESLGVILDATRADERANVVGQQLDAMTESLRGDHKRGDNR